MTLATLKSFLLWSFAINYGVLLLWTMVTSLAHDLLYRLSARLFHVTEPAFDAVNFAGIVGYKACILFFVLVPWLVLALTT
jgi:hypothetical protein